MLLIFNIFELGVEKGKKKMIMWQLEKIKDVNFKNFGILEENSYFGKNKNNIYYKGDKSEKIDRNNFKVLNESYDNSIIKDKNGIYILTKESKIKTIEIDKKIKNIDFNSFEEITNNPYIFKDKNSKYYHGERIK